MVVLKVWDYVGDLCEVARFESCGEASRGELALVEFWILEGFFPVLCR